MNAEPKRYTFGIITNPRGQQSAQPIETKGGTFIRADDPAVLQWKRDSETLRWNFGIPTFDGWYLCYLSRFEDCGSTNYVFGVCYCMNATWCLHDGEGVIAWMKLPESPKKSPAIESIKEDKP